MIRQFQKESKSQPNNQDVSHTILNVIQGIKVHGLHDIWMDDSNRCYCLCKTEIDSDGEAVYTAYQLWIAPEVRDLAKVRSLIKFIKFYASKQRYKRLYVLSSRLDQIKAYARGLGKDFKMTSVIFSKDL